MADSLSRIGNWAFIAGVLIAILAGLVPNLPDTTVVVLVVLGLVVGFLNVTMKETTAYLVAAIALLVAGSAGLGSVPGIGTYLGSILSNIAAFVAPAAVIVALRGIFALAAEE